MMRCIFRVCLPFALLLHWLCLNGAEGEADYTGYKYIKNYSREVYTAPPQNWAILRDLHGVVNVANQGGLLRYDGVAWKAVNIPNVITRGLAMDNDGIVYLGGSKELGFLKKGPRGGISYVSLVGHLDKGAANFSYIVRAHATGEGVYFRAKKFLFRWRPAAGKMNTWRPLTRDGSFKGSFTCRGVFYVRHQGLGLMRMVKDSLQPVPGGEIFASLGIFVMVPYDGKRLLVGTRDGGFFLFDGRAMIPFPTGADGYVKEKKLSYGIALASFPGRFALATLRGGVVIMDKRGRVLELYTKASGLQDDNVKSIYEDTGGALWLALDSGISRIEYGSPFSVLDTRSGLAGIVLSAARAGPGLPLYAGTSRGLYVLKDRRFHPVIGISDNCSALLARGGAIWAATGSGVFRVEENQKNPGPGGHCKYTCVLPERANFLLLSSHAPGVIHVGAGRGLRSIYTGPGTWTVKNELKEIREDIQSVAEDPDGGLWLGTMARGVLHVKKGRRAPGGPATFVVNRYGSLHGLPAAEIHVFNVADHVTAATVKGLFRFNAENRLFVPDFTLGRKFAGPSQGISSPENPSTEPPQHVFRISRDTRKQVWFVSNFRIFRALPGAGGQYSVHSKTFLRLPERQVNSFYHDPDGKTTWLAREDGLIRYDSTVKKDVRREFRTLIREVLLLNNMSALYPGFRGPAPSRLEEGSEGAGTAGATSPAVPVLDYEDRNIRFLFAAPFFEEETANRFQFFLEGYDRRWSQWTGETQKDYTNLGAGTYTFRVRGRNIYETVGREDTFRFEILPPWYQTWWAYALYGLLLVSAVALLVRWRSARHVRERIRLEGIIKERTAEIETKNLQLKELDQAKSRFFANISHEFRTPLTLIMGPLEQILTRSPGKELKADAGLMLRNARRLLHLVNQLLELARLDSGKQELEAARQDIVPVIRNIVACFDSLARENRVDLRFYSQWQDAFVFFDLEKFEKILSNLLSNAFNYTSSGGKITVSLHLPPGAGARSGWAEISVTDTGTGIPPERLPYVFDRFYQAGHEHKRKGSGIGLALTKELVELHHGEISVRSECKEGPARGTEFTVRLPLGEAHLREGERVDRVDSALTPMYRPEPETVSLERPPPETPDNKGDDARPLVLVVDDNADIRAYVRGGLEPRFRVAEAVDGNDGVSRARDIIPDLIISDVMMPGIDGFQLCRTLKQDVLTSHIPIILLTARTSESGVLEGLESGADDYVFKPFSPVLLAARTGNLVALRRQLRQERANRLRRQPQEIPASSIDEDFYKRLQQAVDDGMADPDFNVDALCRAMDMSQATLYRKVKALTGKSTARFIRSFRLKRAAQLLGAGAGNVSEVAEKTGIPDTSYFTKCFKQQFSCLPSDFLPAAGTAAMEHMDDMAHFENLENLEKGEVNGIEVPPHPAGDNQKPLVLVVEDNDDARSYIRDSLQADYRVLEAERGDDGISRSLEEVPDLIVSDVMMPGTDGYQLCRALKQDVRTCHIPIILLTANASEEGIMEGLEAGADDYITKPFNAHILSVRIQNLIRLRRNLQDQRDREMKLVPSKVSESQLDREFMEEVDRTIEKHLADEEFHVDELAKKLYMSSATLYRKLRALSGESPSEYLRSYRLNRAARMLRSGAGSVTEVAFETGFKSRSNFARCFKEMFHQSPSVYMVAQPGGIESK